MTTDKKTGDDDRYAKRGVSSSKDDIHSAISALDKGIFPNAFCKILPDFLGGDKDYCNIGHADGAGTKSALAYLYWKITGDSSVFRGIAKDAFIMNLDDLLCAGITNEPIIYIQNIDRNKFVLPPEATPEIINSTEAFIKQMNDFGLNISYGGGETADVPDLSRTLLVNATMTARMKRKDVIVPSMEVGSIIVGLSSFGRASYEDEYNSGIGSNGLTSARHDIFMNDYMQNSPETFSPENDPGLIYCGNYRVDDEVSINGWPKIPMGKLVLSPTRTYAPIILELKRILEAGDVQALIHCSGGGQTKVKRFLPEGVMALKSDLFENEFFSIIQKESGTTWQEMYQTYNMGHRMEVYCKNTRTAFKVAEVANSFNVDAKIVGYCVERVAGDPAVRIIHRGETYDY